MLNSVSWVLGGYAKSLVQESAADCRRRFGHVFAIGLFGLYSNKKLPGGGVFSLEPQTYAPDLKNQVGTLSDVNI